MRKLLIVLLVTGLLAKDVFATAITNVTSGNWTDTNTWSTLTVPSTNDDVVVTNLSTVMFDTRDFVIVNSLTVDAGGIISADDLGDYEGGYGLGMASHGGLGGYWEYIGHQEYPLPVYGSIIAPTNVGKCAQNYYTGGGVVLIRANSIVVNGVISASCSQYLFGKSGGSVFLTTGTFSGSGSIGANASYSQQVAGGGRGKSVV